MSDVTDMDENLVRDWFKTKTVNCRVLRLGVREDISTTLLGMEFPARVRLTFHVSFVSRSSPSSVTVSRSMVQTPRPKILGQDND